MPPYPENEETQETTHGYTEGGNTKIKMPKRISYSIGIIEIPIREYFHIYGYIEPLSLTINLDFDILTKKKKLPL